MNRPTITVSVVVLALFLSSCASEQIAPPTASVVPTPVPTDIGDAVDLAKTQRSAGDLDGATATLSQLVLVAPDDPRVLGEYGKILVDRGESADALAFLQRAIELSPGEWSFYSAQGVAFAQRGDLRAAQMAFGRALTLKPNDPVILNNFALAHLQAGNLDQAEALLLRASMGGDSLPKIAQNLALVRQMRGGARPGAPTGATAVPPTTLNRTTESEAVASVDDVRTPDVHDSVEAADVEAIEVQETAMEMAEDPIAAPEIDVAASDPTHAIEESTKEIVVHADEPILGNETIETVELEVVETAEDSTQEIVAIVEETEAEDEAIETLAREEEESVSDALESGIWIPSTGPIYLQVGAFASEENAARIVEKLDSLEPQIALAPSGEQTLHRVVVGPYANRGETHAAFGALGEFGIVDVQVLTRFPGEAQQRDEIAGEDPSGTALGDLASEDPEKPQISPSFSYAGSL